MVGRQAGAWGEESQDQDPTDLAGIQVVIPHYRAPEPQVCKRADNECRRQKVCLFHKYQNIPSCKRAKTRCSEIPAGEQALMPFCESCLEAGRDIKGCQAEAIQCSNTRDICFKVRQKVRVNSCLLSPKPPPHWSVSFLRDLVAAQNTTDDCATAVLAEIAAYEAANAAALQTWTKTERKQRYEAQHKMDLARAAMYKVRGLQQPPNVNKVIVGVKTGGFAEKSVFPSSKHDDKISDVISSKKNAYPVLDASVLFLDPE
eukprot:CAMPEP_0196583806 /NCGR_PEP_ID=MMETSP1081-20130531/44751_1 /TAXON_ID=36882 /ORGANISM="Pyramimonas amylifera, Strain CCMP720" /LENGTH=258 /DNA_ID=CAMNT_0041904805 /DNA_START=269 /DNA_END=1045 /DNA_ORIENTATION=+